VEGSVSSCAGACGGLKNDACDVDAKFIGVDQETIHGHSLKFDHCMKVFEADNTYDFFR